MVPGTSSIPYHGLVAKGCGLPGLYQARAGCWSGIQTRKVLSNSSSTKDSKRIKIRGEGGGLHLSALMASQDAICFLFNTVLES